MSRSTSIDVQPDVRSSPMHASFPSSPSTSLTAFSPSTSPPPLRNTPKLPLHVGDTTTEKVLVSSPGSPTARGLWGYWKPRRKMNVVLAGALISAGILWSRWDHLGDVRAGTPTQLEYPGVVIGENGVYNPSAQATDTVHHPNRPDLTPPTPLQTWGLDLSATHFLDGLTPWPENPPYEDQPPLSALGHVADSVYHFGPATLPEYFAQLSEFVDVAFPPSLAKPLRDRLAGYLHSGADAKTEKWDVRKAIWQTDKDESRVKEESVIGWKQGLAKDEGWQWEMVPDRKASKYVAKMLGGSRMEAVWNALPSGILRSDMLRYLLLGLEGGIYTDTDTVLLKSPSHWGQDAKLWRDGAGWLDGSSLERIQAGDSPNDVLGPPSVIVGVEADVGEREDWHDWWARPMQIVQWTIASAPSHPIALSALLRILHATGRAIEWAHDHASKVKALNDLGRYSESRKLLETDVLAEPNQGGPVGVMDWTGPGVWTDAVLSYLRVKYGMAWVDLKGIQEPLRVGDIVILPVTGFSPGVGNFGAQPAWHAQAMVEHKFRGSWKGD